MTNHALIARLESGETGREIDAALLPVISKLPWRFVQWDGAGGVYRDEINRIRHMRDDNIPKYTTSLDAAVALVERVRPGWGWKEGAFGGGGSESPAVLGRGVCGSYQLSARHA